MAKRKVAMGLVLLFGLAAAAGAATVTYDLVPVADPAVRTITVAPGAGVQVQLTVLLEPEGSPTNGLANVTVNLYTDLGIAQTPLTLDPGFTAVFPLFANGGTVENDDLTQIGGFQNLGGTPTTGIGIGTPLVVGTMTLKTPATPGAYQAALNVGATMTVLNSSPPPTYIEANAVAGTPLTITVAASGGGGGGGGTVENQAPTAVADANPKEGQAPLNVSFVGTGSSDPDGDQLSYSWDFGDGTNGTGATSTYQYAEAGTYTATLTVDDARGGTDTSDAITITVTAAPLPPDDDGNGGDDGGSDGDGSQDGDGTGDIDDPEPGADGDDVISPPPAVLPCGAGIVETAMLTFAGLFLIQSGRRRY